MFKGLGVLGFLGLRVLGFKVFSGFGFRGLGLGPRILQCLEIIESEHEQTYEIGWRLGVYGYM